MTTIEAAVLAVLGCCLAGAVAAVACLTAWMLEIA